MLSKTNLLNNFREWCIENNYIPEIKFFVSENSNIPQSIIEQDNIMIINVSPEAVGLFEISDNRIDLEVSFGKKIHKICVDTNSIISIGSSGTSGSTKEHSVELVLDMQNLRKSFKSYYDIFRKNIGKMDEAINSCESQLECVKQIAKENEKGKKLNHTFNKNIKKNKKTIVH